MEPYMIITILISIGSLIIAIVSLLDRKARFKSEENKKSIEDLSDLIDDTRKEIHKSNARIDVLEERLRNEKEMLDSLGIKMDKIIELLYKAKP